MRGTAWFENAAEVPKFSTPLEIHCEPAKFARTDRSGPAGPRRPSQSPQQFAMSCPQRTQKTLHFL